MLRYILVVLALALVACSKPTRSQPSSDEAKSARAFMEKMDKDRGYHLGMGDPIRREIANEKLDGKALLRGSIKLLQRAKPEERRKAARFLGRLGDRSAIVPLVKALDDQDQALRDEICYALQWLDAKGEPGESALVKLRREDPSIDVRVAAALALGRPKDKDAVAAFQLGLRSTKNGWVREICEDELEKMGKLELPLPEHVYTEIRKEEYQEIRADRRWYTVRRLIRKGDTIYFEAVEHPRHAPQFPHWYRTKLGPADAGPR